jgi:TIR domain
LRHFAASQQFGRFRSEADINGGLQNRIYEYLAKPAKFRPRKWLHFSSNKTTITIISVHLRGAMSSLAKYYSSNLVGFFSYSREDDVDFDQVLSKFRTTIQAELSAQLGRNHDNFRIWQDASSIPHGALWQQRIVDAIKQSAFFIPIITPRVVNSRHCAFEFDLFLARERELGRDDLIFPILYISVPELENETWEHSSLLKIVKDRQYFDWRDYRPRELRDSEVRTRIIQFCRNLADALRKSWESPEERQQRQQAEAERIAAKKESLMNVSIEAEPIADEELKRREVQTARKTDEQPNQAEESRSGKKPNSKVTEAPAAVASKGNTDPESSLTAAKVQPSPVSPAELPKWKQHRTATMAGGALAAVLGIGLLVWTLSNRPSETPATSPYQFVAPNIRAPEAPPATLSGPTTLSPAAPSQANQVTALNAPAPVAPPATASEPTTTAPTVSRPAALSNEIADPGADVVRAFYTALGRGDGAAAAAFVIPERQKGGLSSQEMTHFFSTLAEPLQLISVASNGQNTYQASYTYRASTKICNNTVIVSLTRRNGKYLIQNIDAHGGC